MLTQEQIKRFLELLELLNQGRHDEIDTDEFNSLSELFYDDDNIVSAFQNPPFEDLPLDVF